MIKIVDVADPNRVSRVPDQTIELLSSGNFSEQEFVIQSVKLKLFIEKNDEKLGPFSIITSVVETDKGSVEMIYDEGFRGENALQRTADFITSNLGMSAIILRSIISLRDKLENQNT